MDRLARSNLLFLEDNSEFALNTSEFLKLYFKNVFLCRNIKEALLAYNENRIDVIISDIMIEGRNAIEFIENIRSDNTKCIIAALSAYSDHDTLLRAIPLNLAAYKLKPIRHEDFMLLLKTIGEHIEPRKKARLSKEILYDYAVKELFLKDSRLKLTKKEVMFLELLIEQFPKTVTHERLQRDIWESRVMSDAALKNMVLRLRKKIGADIFKNVHAFGYKLLKAPSF